jgi:hypothetical protein
MKIDTDEPQLKKFIQMPGQSEAPANSSRGEKAGVSKEGDAAGCDGLVSGIATTPDATLKNNKGQAGVSPVTIVDIYTVGANAYTAEGKKVSFEKLGRVHNVKHNVLRMADLDLETVPDPIKELLKLYEEHSESKKNPTARPLEPKRYMNADDARQLAELEKLPDPEPEDDLEPGESTNSSPKKHKKTGRFFNDRYKKKSENQVGKLPTVEEWRASLKDIKYEPQIIQDLLPAQPGSYGVIAGRTGIGKTNLVLHLSHCLATGTPFFNFKCQKVKVAVLAFEGDQRNLDDRITKISANFEPTDGNLRFGILPVQNPAKMLDEAKTLLRNTEDIQVVIFDPIKFLVLGDYLKPACITEFISEFMELLNELNLLSIVTLPISKPQDKKGLIHPQDIYSIKGGTEWVDSATFGILVEKRAYTGRDEKEVTLSVCKHRIATTDLEDINLRFDSEKCIYVPTIVNSGTKVEVDLGS